MFSRKDSELRAVLREFDNRNSLLSYLQEGMSQHLPNEVPELSATEVAAAMEGQTSSRTPSPLNQWGE